MKITELYDSCGTRAHNYQPMEVSTGYCSGTTILQWLVPPAPLSESVIHQKLEYNSRRARGNSHAVHDEDTPSDFLSRYD